MGREVRHLVSFVEGRELILALINVLLNLGPFNPEDVDDRVHVSSVAEPLQESIEELVN